MPGIEFSTLTAQELRSLEGALRRRDQSGLADEVAAELATRGRRAPQWSGGALRNAAGPAWTIEPAAGADHAPRRGVPVALAASAAALLAVGLGWSLNRTPEPAPAVLPVVVAEPQPPAPPRPAATLVPTLPTTPQPSVSAVPAPAHPAAARPAPLIAPPPPLVVAAEPPTVVAGPRPPEPVSDEQRLRRAYERAMATGVDPRVVDRGQARWRKRLERSQGVRRAVLYDQRIRELERLAGG
jgi:hypothetical protein